MVALGGWLLRGLCVVAPGGHAWLLWGGVHGCSQGAGCVVAPGGHAWDTTRYRDTVNERSVCILLECILVLKLPFVCLITVSKTPVATCALIEGATDLWGDIFYDFARFICTVCTRRIQ